MYERYTKEFIKRWKNQISIISTSDEYLRDYYSFEFRVRAGFIILIPHKLVVFESLRSKDRIFKFLDRIHTLKELLFYVERSCREDSFHLNNTDVEIIKKLTSKEFYGQSEKIPTFEKIANTLGCHRNTISRRIRRLIDSYVLSFIYKVDLSVLGYETFFTIVRQEKKSLKNLNHYFLASTPISGIVLEKQNRYKLILAQIPYNKPKIFWDLKENSNSMLFIPLLYEYIGWNLSALTSNDEERWNLIPPILEIFSWDDDIISRNAGIQLSLVPKNKSKRLLPVDKKILDLYAYHNNIEDIEIAKRVKVTEKYVRESRSRLLDDKILKLYVHVSNIGIAFRPWITIIGENTKTHKATMRKIIEHMKFFPHTRLFYNLEASRPVITGYLFLPESWISDFMYKFSQLADIGFRVQIGKSYSTKVKKSINISKTSS